MRIALVIKGLVLSAGGAERFACNLIRGLNARGHRITVFCHEWDDEAEKLDPRFVAVPRPRGMRHPWSQFSRNVWAAIRAQNESYDIVFGLTQLCPQDVHRLGGGVYDYWYRRKYGRWFPLHTLLPRVGGALRFERRMYAPGSVRQVITISNLDRELLLRAYDVPPERVQTVYNGFDHKEFFPGDRASARSILCDTLRIDPRTTVVLFAANNHVRKGLPQAVEALLRTPDPRRFSLVVIGKSNRHVARRLKARIGTAFNAVWLDRVHNPADYYRGSDVFLFPTQYDSFANVIGESLCCGLPVITTRQAGGAEMVIDGTNGFVVRDYTAVGEMAARAALFASRDMAAGFSRRAPEIVTSYTIDRCARETEAVLVKAYEEKQRRNG